MCKTCGHIEAIPTYWTPTAGLGDYIQKIFDRILKSGKIDKEQLQNTYNTLYKGVEKGYGKKLVDIDYNTPDAQKLAFMQRNVFVFSAYKSYQNVLEVNKALYDDKGNVRPFNEFKKLATSIDEVFNKRYLETEYNLSVLSGRAASQWQEFENMADSYPLLQYQTIGDANVRPEHALLDGVIRPINDAFWRTFFPPNDWGCRCDVVQVTDEDAKPTPKENIATPEMKEIFKNNVGITGKVFPDSHPYYNVLKEHQNDANNLWGLNPPMIEKKVDLQPNMGYTEIYSGKKGGSLNLHKDANPEEIKLLTQKGKILADYGHKVEIRPYYENNEGIKNPDYNINGKIADLKSPLLTKNVQRKIQKDFKEAKEQNAKIIIIDINNPILTKRDLKRALGGSLTNLEHYKIIEEVWLLNKKNKLYTITRKDIVNKNYLGIIDDIPDIPME